MLALSVAVAVGVLLVLSRDLFRLVVGLAVLGSAANLVVFMAARPGSLTPPVIESGALQLAANAVDPLPQALVLTAIVIGFATTGFVIELALRSRHESDSDHVDGRPDRQDAA